MWLVQRHIQIFHFDKTCQWHYISCLRYMALGNLASIWALRQAAQDLKKFFIFIWRLGMIKRIIWQVKKRFQPFQTMMKSWNSYIEVWKRDDLELSTHFWHIWVLQVQLVLLCIQYCFDYIHRHLLFGEWILAHIEFELVLDGVVVQLFLWSCLQLWKICGFSCIELIFC